MSVWAWSLLAISLCLLLYAALVLALISAGRRESARALAGFIPDCVVLCSRLLREPRVQRRKKTLGLLLAVFRGPSRAARWSEHGLASERITSVRSDPPK